MKRRAFLALAGAGATAGLAGCFDGQAAATGDNRVEMTMDSFRPEELTVSPGTTVEFVNTSSHGHTVTGVSIPDEADDSEYFASGDFDDETAAQQSWEKNNGGILVQGETYENEFVTPGRYDYICIPHIRVGMQGVIHVEEGADE